MSANATKSNQLALSHYEVSGWLEILSENPVWWESKNLLVSQSVLWGE